MADDKSLENTMKCNFTALAYACVREVLLMGNSVAFRVLSKLGKKQVAFFFVVLALL